MNFAGAGAGAGSLNWTTGLKSDCILAVGDQPRFALHSFGLRSFSELKFTGWYYNLSWTGQFSYKEDFRSQEQRKKTTNHELCWYW